MGSECVKLDFYSVTTSSDGVPVETLLYSQVAGTLETESQVLAERINMASFVQLLVFFPGQMLSGIETGTTAKNGTTVYSVQYIETYSDHQEIYFRKNNL
jgi:hypothetical protein